MPEKPESLKDVFENLKKDGILKSPLTYEGLQSQREQEDIERGKFEPKIILVKNPQKKPLSQRMQEEGEFKNEQEKSDFDFVFGID